jgi:hypothetical protein
MTRTSEAQAALQALIDEEASGTRSPYHPMIDVAACLAAWGER